MTEVTVQVVGDVLVIVAPAVAAQELAAAAFEVGPRRAANGQPFRPVTANLMAKLRAVGPLGGAGCERAAEPRWLTGEEAGRLLGNLSSERLRQLALKGVIVGEKRGRGGRDWRYDRSSVSKLAEVRGLR